MDALLIEDERARVAVVPQLGGGLASFDALTPNGPLPVLRPLASGQADPFDLSCNVMVPFANRISGGGFVFDGRFRPVEPNLTGHDPLPLHGDALQRPWKVVSQQAHSVTLSLEQGAIGPWRYRAELTWRLEAGALSGTLTLTNRGERLPFGGGFHPWLPRLPETRLRFAAGKVWLAGGDKLPTALVSLSERPEWDFTRERPLPDDLIDNCFSGWRGEAHVAQPNLGIDVLIRGGTHLDHAMVFSPGPHADHFCFEPVSHAVDAINAPGHAGMTLLAKDQQMTLPMALDWQLRP